MTAPAHSRKPTPGTTKTSVSRTKRPKRQWQKVADALIFVGGMTDRRWANDIVFRMHVTGSGRRFTCEAKIPAAGSTPLRSPSARATVDRYRLTAESDRVGLCAITLPEGISDGPVA